MFVTASVFLCACRLRDSIKIDLIMALAYSINIILCMSKLEHFFIFVMDMLYFVFTVGMFLKSHNVATLLMFDTPYANLQLLTCKILFGIEAVIEIYVKVKHVSLLCILV